MYCFQILYLCFCSFFFLKIGEPCVIHVIHVHVDFRCQYLDVQLSGTYAYCGFLFATITTSALYIMFLSCAAGQAHNIFA